MTIDLTFKQFQTILFQLPTIVKYLLQMQVQCLLTTYMLSQNKDSWIKSNFNNNKKNIIVCKKNK